MRLIILSFIIITITVPVAAESSVEVIASGGMEQADAKLVALSQLPTGFDREVFTDQLMYGYSLVFGFDPTEFWPVNAGALGITDSAPLWGVALKSVLRHATSAHVDCIR